MPTYAYACRDCGHTFEARQSFTDDALTTCPECGGHLRKVFNSVGVVFKGSGFYRTDSRDSSKSTSSSSESNSSKSESGTSGSGTSDVGKSESAGSGSAKSSDSSGSSSSASSSSTKASGSAPAAS